MLSSPRGCEVFWDMSPKVFGTLYTDLDGFLIELLKPSKFRQIGVSNKMFFQSSFCHQLKKHTADAQDAQFKQLKSSWDFFFLLNRERFSRILKLRSFYQLKAKLSPLFHLSPDWKLLFWLLFKVKWDMLLAQLMKIYSKGDKNLNARVRLEASM